MHVDTGFYAGLVNVFTPHAIRYKLLELERHKGEPLLLQDVPLEEQFSQKEAVPRVVRDVEEAWFVPPVRNPPITYQPIVNYILSHYRYERSVSGLSIWQPLD